jgi:type IV secretion system protein VirD4
MVSRQETARPLLTPGEVMQLPPDDELVLVSGVPPIRAKKARYFEDPRLTERVLAPPAASEQGGAPSVDDWSLLPVPAVSTGHEVSSSVGTQIDDPANGGIRREPELPQHEQIVPEQVKAEPEFVFGEDDTDDDAARARALRQQARGLARQAAMDPGDGMDL